MWLRDESGDALGSMRGLVFGCVLGLISWAMIYLGIVAVWPILKTVWRAL